MGTKKGTRNARMRRLGGKISVESRGGRDGQVEKERRGSTYRS